MSKVEGVFIDWDGTSCVDKFWGHLEGQNLYSKIQQFLFTENKNLVIDWMIGKVNVNEVVLRIAQGTQLDSGLLYRELKKSCKEMKLVSPEILELARMIRLNGVQVAIATDNMDTFTKWTAPALGLQDHFDGILNSYELGVSKRKGSPFFGIFLEQNGVDPKNCVIIDDSEDRDNVLAKYGFDYRKIERGIGLVPELRNILENI